mgnify:CR=1 FL=1
MKEEAPEDEARAAGLVYVSDDAPGVRRRRCGRGFTYVLPSGKTLRDEAIRERIDDLAIPPGWTDVWICPDPDGHLQATGRDEEDRKQYRYHPRWVEARHAAKFRRVRALGERLPGVRRRVGRHLAREGLEQERVLAAVVRLLDRTGLRIGYPEYEERHGSHGLTTLRRKHATVRGSRLTLEFTGKGGGEVRVELDAHDAFADLDLCVWDPYLNEYVLCLLTPGDEYGSFTVAAGFEFHLVVDGYFGGSPYDLYIETSPAFFGFAGAAADGEPEAVLSVAPLSASAELTAAPSERRAGFERYLEAEPEVEARSVPRIVLAPGLPLLPAPVVPLILPAD